MMILKKNGLSKEVPTGFSWTTLLFGVFVPLFRGDLTGFAIQTVLAILTGGFSWLVVPFTCNKAYLNRLIEKGWIIN